MKLGPAVGLKVNVRIAAGYESPLLAPSDLFKGPGPLGCCQAIWKDQRAVLGLHRRGYGAGA